MLDVSLGLLRPLIAARQQSGQRRAISSERTPGNGQTSGALTQQFIVPGGATRLVLGTMDGFGWFNNSGSFSVDITTPVNGGGNGTGNGNGTVPEPASLLLLGMGIGGLGLRRARSR